MSDVAQNKEEVVSESELQHWMEQRSLVDDSEPCEPTQVDFEKENIINNIQEDGLLDSFVRVEISRDQIEQNKLITYLSQWDVCKISADQKYGAVAWSSPVYREHLLRKKIVINFLGTGTGPIFGRHAHYSSADSENPISGGHVLCVDAITCGEEMPTIVVRGVGTKALVDDAPIGTISNPQYMPDCLGETVSGWGVNHRVKLVLEQFALKNIFAIVAEEIIKGSDPSVPMEITLEIFGHSRGGVTCFAFANAFDKFLEACKSKDADIIKTELKRIVAPGIGSDPGLFDAIFSAIINNKIKFNLKIMALDPVEGAACLSEFQSSTTHSITPATLKLCGANISYNYIRLPKIVSQVAIVCSVDEHRQSFRISIPGISEETTVVLIPALAGHSAVTGYTTNCAGAKEAGVATWLKLDSADKVSFYYNLQDGLRDLGLIRIVRWRSNDDLSPCRADFIRRNYQYIQHIAELYKCNSPDAIYRLQLESSAFRHLLYDAIERAICEEYLLTKDPLKVGVIKAWREAARVDTASGLWVDPAAGHRWSCQWRKTEDNYDWRRLDDFSGYPSALYPQPVDIGGAHSPVYDVTLAYNLHLAPEKVFSIYHAKHGQMPVAENVDPLIVATLEINLLLGQINRSATHLAGVNGGVGFGGCFVELQKKLELFNKYDIGHNTANEILVLIIKRLCFQYKVCGLPAMANALELSGFARIVIAAAYETCLLNQMTRLIELVKGYKVDLTKLADVKWAIDWSKQQLDGIIQNIRFCNSNKMLTPQILEFIQRDFKLFLNEFSSQCGEDSKLLVNNGLAELERIMLQETDLSKEQLITRISEITRERDQATANVMQAVDYGRELLAKVSQLTANLEGQAENACTIERLQETNAKYAADLTTLKTKLELYESSAMEQEEKTQTVNSGNEYLKRDIQILKKKVEKYEQAANRQRLEQAPMVFSAKVAVAECQTDVAATDAAEAEQQLIAQDLLAQLHNANTEIEELKLLLAAIKENIAADAVARQIVQPHSSPLPRDEDYSSLGVLPSPVLTPRLAQGTQEIQTETPYVDPQQATIVQQELELLCKELEDMAAKYDTAKIQAALDLQQANVALAAKDEVINQLQRQAAKVIDERDFMKQTLLAEQQAYALTKVDLVRDQAALLAEQQAHVLTRVDLVRGQAALMTKQREHVLTKVDLVMEQAALLAERQAHVSTKASFVTVTGERDVAKAAVVTVTGERDAVTITLQAEQQAHALAQAALLAEQQAHALAQAALLAERQAHALSQAALQAEQQAHALTNADLVREQAALLAEQQAHVLTNADLVRDQAALLAEQQAHALTNADLVRDQAALQAERIENARLHGEIARLNGIALPAAQQQASADILRAIWPIVGTASQKALATNGYKLT